MHFADDKEEVGSLAGIEILGKASWRDGAASFQGNDIQTREYARAD
jgi:hypothetical protein